MEFPISIGNPLESKKILAIVTETRKINLLIVLDAVHTPTLFPGPPNRSVACLLCGDKQFDACRAIMVNDVRVLEFLRFFS